MEMSSSVQIAGASDIVAAQAFEIAPPAHCRLLPSSRRRQLAFRHGNASCCRYLPSIVVFQGISGSPCQPAHPHSSGSWLWRRHSTETSGLASSVPDSTTGSSSVVIRWLGSILYRALLVGGVGLGLMQTAAAYATPAVSEAVLEKVSFGKQKEAENGLQNSEEKESVSALGDEFWKGLELVRGSPELILKKVLDSDPTNLSALECLAKTLIDDDDFSRALVVLEKLEGLQPNEMEWKYMKAEAYDLDGKSKMAKEIFEDILKVEPFSPRALQGLVLAMDQLDEGDTALKILEDTWKKAKEENNHAEAGNFGILIGQIYTFKGRMQEALQHFKTMIDEDATDCRPYLCQGIIYSVLGEMDTAEKSFQTFEKLCPKDLPERELFAGLMSRAKKEGQRVFEFKQKQKAKAGSKGGKKS